jgi:hypothetical protein
VSPLAASLGLAVAAAFFSLLLRFERTGRPHHTLYVLLAVITVDALVNPASFTLKFGLFRIPVGPNAILLPELVLVVALAARLVARLLKPGPAGPSSTGWKASACTRAPRLLWSPDLLWWGAFLAWMAAATVRGLLGGAATDVVFFEVRAGVYLGGILALTAGVPLGLHLGPDGFPRLVRWMAVGALVFGLLDVTGLRIDAELPGLPLEGFGQMGADAATILGSFGLLGIALAVVRGAGPLDFAAGLVMLASPLLAEQRAGLASGITGILVVALLARLRVWRAVPPGGGRRLGLIALGVLGAVVLFGAVRLVASPSVPLPHEQFQRTFETRGKQQSWQARVNQWAAAPKVIAERPWTGWGLGKKYRHFEPGPDLLYSTDITHNLLLDLLLRMGLAGLVLFLAATAASIRRGLVALRRAADDRVAVTALTLVAVLAGLLTKAMAESITEKPRLAVLLAVLIGLLHGAGVSDPADPEPAPAAAAPAASGAA